MRKIIAILFIIIVLPMSAGIPKAEATEHGVADGSCSPTCAAREECLIYVMLFNDEDFFYSYTDISDKTLVQDFCVFGVGLIIT